MLMLTSSYKTKKSHLYIKDVESVSIGQSKCQGDSKESIQIQTTGLTPSQVEMRSLRFT